jgi:hypothetical protein
MQFNFTLKQKIPGLATGAAPVPAVEVNPSFHFLFSF